jgi:hypothetical protein
LCAIMYGCVRYRSERTLTLCFPDLQPSEGGATVCCGAQWCGVGMHCTLSTEPPTTPSERPCTQLTIGSSGQDGGATMSACSLAAVGRVRKHDGLMAELASGRWWHHGYRADTRTAGMARQRRGVTASGVTRVLQPTWPCCAGVSAVHASSAANFCTSMTCLRRAKRHRRH